MSDQTRSQATVPFSAPSLGSPVTPAYEPSSSASASVQEDRGNSLVSGDLKGARWYVIQVKRHNEHRVVNHLGLRGCHLFLPLIEVIRPYQTRRTTSFEPLFPGYVFVKMEHIESNPRQWDAVRWCPGVRLILGIANVPSQVPDEAIEAIQERVKELGFVRRRVGFASGSPVRFRGGPFSGLDAVFDRVMSQSGRVRVLLELLGQPRSVEVDTLDLESA